LTAYGAILKETSYDFHRTQPLKQTSLPPSELLGQKSKLNHNIRQGDLSRNTVFDEELVFQSFTLFIIYSLTTEKVSIAIRSQS
jgi:hypothetical protein